MISKRLWELCKVSWAENNRIFERGLTSEEKIKVLRAARSKGDNDF